ncbi:lipocalin family protein [Chryseobacterium sp. CBSDS_008]|uniref:lipocalin family protein n=1 Tax=Chryseobacterium sp. CBSDS_008 TaxID=3415265 RepID=UPI003CF6AB40
MKKLFLLALLGLMTGCNSSSEKNIKIGFSSKASVPNPYRENLSGKWLPVAGKQSEKQGFELQDNGTATSVNIHTLQYDKWNVSEDTLYLWYHTVGVKMVSKGIDTFIIKEIDDSDIVLSPIESVSSDSQYYKKEN